MLLRPGLLSHCQQSNLKPQKHSCQGIKVLVSPLGSCCWRQQKQQVSLSSALQEGAETFKGPHGTPNTSSLTRSSALQHSLLPTAVVMASGLFAAILCAMDSTPSPYSGANASATPSVVSHASSTKSRAIHSKRSKAALRSQRAHLANEIKEGKQSLGTEAVNPVIASMAAIKAGLPKYKGIAAFASAAAPLLLSLALAPRIATALRGGTTSLKDRSSANHKSSSSGNSSSTGSGSIDSSHNKGGIYAVEDPSSLSLALREATSRAQSLLQRFASSSSSSSSNSIESLGSSYRSGPKSAVPAQGRMVGAGQLLKGTRPLAPSLLGRRATAGPSAVIKADPRSNADTSDAIQTQGQGRAAESGSAGEDEHAEDDRRKAAFARRLIAAAMEANRSSSSMRWASRAQLRGSGFVLPDDAPKVAPGLRADGSLPSSEREQLMAPASSASKADVNWAEEGGTKLAEEIKQWSTLIRRGTQREAAEAIQSSIDLAYAVLRAVDKKAEGPSSMVALDSKGINTMVPSSIADTSSSSSSSSSSNSNSSSIADTTTSNSNTSSIADTTSSSILGTTTSSSGGNSNSSSSSTVGGCPSSTDLDGSTGSNGSEKGDFAREAASAQESGSSVSLPDGHPHLEGSKHSDAIAQLVDFMAELPEQVEARDRNLQQQSTDPPRAAALDGGAPELAPASSPPNEQPFPSVATSRAGDAAADAADATATAAATAAGTIATPPPGQGPMGSSPPTPSPPETEFGSPWALPISPLPSLQEREAAIVRRIQAVADAVKRESLQRWISAVAQQREADWQAAAALEAELAEKQAALDAVTEQARVLCAQAAAQQELMAWTAADAAAAAAEEQRQADERATALQRQQAYRQQVQAEFLLRKAAWSMKEAAEKEEQAIQEEERARAAVEAAEAQREREAAARAQTEAMTGEEARRAEQAVLEAQQEQEQAAQEAEAAMQAVAEQRAVLAAQEQAAAEAEVDVQLAAEKAAAAAAHALEEQERAARNAEGRDREIAEAQAWAREARLAAEQEASAAREALGMQASMWAQEVGGVAKFGGAVAQQTVLAAQETRLGQEVSAAKDVLTTQASLWGQEVAGVAKFGGAVAQQTAMATQKVGSAAQQEASAATEALGMQVSMWGQEVAGVAKFGGAVAQQTAMATQEAGLAAQQEAAAAAEVVAMQASMWAQEVAGVAKFQAAVAQQAVLASQALAAATQDALAARCEAALQDLAARREAVLQDLAARREVNSRASDIRREAARQDRAARRERYESPEAALEPVLVSTPADWSSAHLRTRSSSPLSKYDPLLQLSGGLCVGQWQEVVHELLSLELAVGTDPDLPHQLPQVMSAAHPHSFRQAYRDFERMQSQPRRLAKVHPGISTWLTAASQVAVTQNRSTTPAEEPQPVWVALRGRQALLNAAMEAWPAFASELERRHPTLHQLVCRGTEARDDEEGNCLRGLAVLATLSAWQWTELGKGALVSSSSSGDSSNVEHLQLDQCSSMESIPSASRVSPI